MRLKSLSLKVTLTVDLTMSFVGALTFSSLVTMILIQNFTTMMTRFFQVVMGVALVGRMVPSSILLDIALIEVVIWVQDRGRGSSPCKLPQKQYVLKVDKNV
jgi:hypothetical protein